MDKCKDCDMPINEETRCSCEPELCYHCCQCGADCDCGCQEKESQ